MITLKEAISNAVDHLKSDVDDALSDGKITINEVLRLTGCAVGSLVGVAQSIDAPGEAKRDAILEGIGELYDKHIEPIDIPWVFGPFERRIDAGVREFLLAAAEGYVDELIEGYNHTAGEGE